jgi:cytoskeletal protein RodZ
MAEEPRELGFGRYLRRQRILRGISRNEVVRVTKVSLDYVEALENDQFEKLPPRAFVVGFLRVLSRYAGLDETEVVNRFLAETVQKKGEEEARIEKIGYFRRHGRTLLALGGLACFLFLMFFPYFRHRS